MNLESKVNIHFIVKNKLKYTKIVEHVPKKGDEVRFNVDEFYEVVRVVWVYDEPNEPWSRANIELVLLTF